MSAKLPKIAGSFKSIGIFKDKRPSLIYLCCFSFKQYPSHQESIPFHHFIATRKKIDKLSVQKSTPYENILFIHFVFPLLYSEFAGTGEM
jgi:hypothetical protein